MLDQPKCPASHTRATTRERAYRARAHDLKVEHRDDDLFAWSLQIPEVRGSFKLGCLVFHHSGCTGWTVRTRPELLSSLLARSVTNDRQHQTNTGNSHIKVSERRSSLSYAQGLFIAVASH